MQSNFRMAIDISNIPSIRSRIFSISTEMKFEEIFSSISCSLAIFLYPSIFEAYSVVICRTMRKDRTMMKILVAYSLPSMVTCIFGKMNERIICIAIANTVNTAAGMLLSRMTVKRRNRM